MKLTILGGGGFRVPLVHGALLSDEHPRRITEVTLYDVDPARLEVMTATLAQQAEGHPRPVHIVATTDLTEALRDADFVFSAIRVGGLAGRTQDERIALGCNVLGQETIGAGGVAYGLRTVPVAMRIAQVIAEVAPAAWVVNFTNPAGQITQAMQQVLGDRVIGICDSPVGLVRRAAGALDIDPDAAGIGYRGLNHLGWLGSLEVDGVDRLPELIANPVALQGIEEGRLFGAEWLTQLGAIPNEYLFYYYFTRDAIASITGSAQTRGEFLLDQQRSFYAAAAAERSRAFELWEGARREREETYMAEAREEGEARDENDLSGGYEGVALRLMSAIARDERTRLILNVRNGSAMAGLPADAVVEVPCEVGSDGATPLPVPALTGHPLGLAQQLKAVDETVIEAAISRSAGRATTAFALHPLVDSVSTARHLMTGYVSAIPTLAEIYGSRRA